MDRWFLPVQNSEYQQDFGVTVTPRTGPVNVIPLGHSVAVDNLDNMPRFR
jgi:hypothetical protein